MTTSNRQWKPPWGGGRVRGGGVGLSHIFLMGCAPKPPNPDPTSDTNKQFTRPYFRPYCTYPYSQLIGDPTGNTSNDIFMAP